MRINKLEMFGFKSFADRTAFEFGSGISCVVGPNGSGKSNVVDALRWVIGEQSARSLRGKDMSDVIFAGSAVRNPVGFAEVTLTLGVGNGEPFPGDFSRFEELEVGRRLYRDGTSEYLINRTKSRRRDIVDLFMDTGVGSNLYSFIAQGQVDRIVSQSPIERRSLIDEAAGISRYKARREEALVRLAATGSQLDRIADVADEMARQLRSLERQVLKAGRFRRARARIKQREIALGVVKYSALSGDRRALRNRLRGLKDDVGALGRSLERVQSDLSTREEELEAVRGAVSNWRDQAAELDARRRELEGAATLHRSRHTELLADAERADERAVRAEQRGAQIVADRAEVVTAKAKATEERDGLQGDELQDALRSCAQSVKDRRAELAALQQRVAERQARFDALSEEQHRLEAAPQAAFPELPVLDDAEGRVRVIQAALDEVSKEMELAVARVDEAQSKEQALQGERDERLKAHELALKQHERAVQDQQRRQRVALDEARKVAAKARNEHTRRERDLRTSAQRRASQWSDAAQQLLSKVERRTSHALQGRLGEIQAGRKRADLLLKQAEQSAQERAAAQVDRTPLVKAKEALMVATEAIRVARDEEQQARQSRGKTEGTVAALQAEWTALEKQRSDAMPDEWAERALFDAVASSTDPRREAIPEILNLPVLDPSDLLGTVGRGVWPTSQTDWVVVDTGAEAVAHLQHHGAPVASRDGAVRVHADGRVELGWQTESRWSAVKVELEEARLASAAAASTFEQASVRVRTAQDAHQRAQDAVKSATAQIQAAEVEAAVTLRAEASAHHRTEQDGFEEEERMARTSADDGRRWVERERASLREQQTAVAAAVRTLVLPGDPSASVLRGWVGADWPAASFARPTAPELPTVDRSASQQARLIVREKEQQLGRLRRDRSSADRELSERQAALAAATARRQALQERAATRMERLRQLSDSLAALPGVEDGSSLSADVAAAELEQQTLQGRLADQRSRRAVLEERVRQAAERMTQLASAEAVASEERVQASADAGLARESAASAVDLAARCEADAGVLAVERSDVVEKLSRDRSRLSKLLEETDRVRKSLTKTQQDLAEGQVALQQTEQRVSGLQLEIEGLRKRLGDRYQVSLPGLLDRLTMRRELVLSPDEAVKQSLTIGEVVLEPVPTLEMGVSLLDDEDRVIAMVEELETLRKELAKIGDVNLASEGEYVELRDRYVDLDQQRTDLEESVKTIRSAIAKMNRTCRERFRDAYDRVNESFQVAYPELVGGGDARLALTNEDDLLETGVDIFVRPPGKRLQNLTLLSGGEKAMTAIALLLALFKVRPSPFCVLDEVDAPLDEANGSRFNEMIRGMSDMSQFIVITHNRKTMECADVLYGVTMAAPGVSSLVSVAIDA